VQVTTSLLSFICHAIYSGDIAISIISNVKHQTKSGIHTASPNWRSQNFPRQMFVLT
jgi:hypothetical protein